MNSIYLLIFFFNISKCLAENIDYLERKTSDYRLSNNFKPIIYEVKLTLDTNSDEIFGNVKLLIKFFIKISDAN